jgi:hypothetical protein
MQLWLHYCCVLAVMLDWWHPAALLPLYTCSSRQHRRQGSGSGRRSAQQGACRLVHATIRRCACSCAWSISRRHLSFTCISRSSRQGSRVSNHCCAHCWTHDSAHKLCPAAAAAGGYGSAVAPTVGYGTANASADMVPVRAKSAGEEGLAQAVPAMGAQVSMPGQEGAQRSERSIKPNQKFAEDA